MEVLAEKRKRDVNDANSQQAAQKRAKSEEAREFAKTMEEAKAVALQTMEDVLAESTRLEYEALYGKQWKAMMEQELQALESKQREELRRRAEREMVERAWRGGDGKHLAIRGLSSALEIE